MGATLVGAVIALVIFFGGGNLLGKYVSGDEYQDVKESILEMKLVIERKVTEENNRYGRVYGKYEGDTVNYTISDNFEVFSEGWADYLSVAMYWIGRMDYYTANLNLTAVPSDGKQYKVKCGMKATEGYIEVSYCSSDDDVFKMYNFDRMRFSREDFTGF